MAHSRRILAATLAAIVFAAIVATIATLDPAAPPAAAQAAPSPYWLAIESLDLAAARTAATTDDHRTFVDLVERALVADPEAAADELAAFASATVELDLRTRATTLVLDMLRGTCRWRALETLHDRWPKLPLGADYLPAGLRATPDVELTLPATPDRLPMIESLSPLCAVEATLQGPKGNTTVVTVLDTGANSCVMTPQLAERLGIAAGEATVTVIDINGKVTTGRPGVLPEFALGNLRARNLPIMLIDFGALGPEVADVGFLLGWEVLQHLAFEVAGSKHELVLRRSEADPDLERNLCVFDQPTVRARSGDVGVLFLLDTGAGATCVRKHLPGLLGLEPASTRNERFPGLAGTVTTEVPVLAKLPFALGKIGLELGNLHVDPQERNPRDLLRVDGTLGIDLAKAMRIVIDGPNHHVRFVVE